MNAVGWRYVVLTATTMFGGTILLGLLFTPVVGALYAIAFGVAYRQHPWLHRTLERISNGKEKRQ